MAVRRTRVLLIGSKNLSSWSLRPWLALRMFNLPFEERVVHYATPQQKEDLRALSPSGLVPCLIEGDVTVWDSLAIIEHIADLFREMHVWPQDRTARATARSISAEMHSGFHALRQEWPMNFAARGLSQPPSAAAERDIARVDTIWRQCREQFGNGGPFLFGAFSAADAMYAPVASRYATYRGESGDAVIDAYVTAVLALKPMQEWAAGAAAEIGKSEAA